MKKFLVLAGLAAMLAVPSFAATSTWNLDPFHSNAQFTVRHLGISNVQGEFSKITGTVMLDDSDLTKSTVSVTIDATSALWCNLFPRRTFSARCPCRDLQS